MSTQEIVNEEILQLTKIQLKKEDFVGKGTKGSVYRYQIKNKQLVVKCFNKQQDAEREGSILEEVKRLTMQCPGIVEYYGMKKLQIEIMGAFDTNYEGYVIFLQEYPLDFENYLNQSKRLSSKEVFEFLSQVGVALICLHANGCYHRDLKPSNIMIKKKNQKLMYYLIDFGESKTFGPQIVFDQNTLSNVFITLYFVTALRGTPNYFPPELWKIYQLIISQGSYGKCKYNPQKADIYSLGMITLKLLLGEQQIRTFRDSENDYNKELEKIKEKLLQIPEFSKQQLLVDMILKMI